MTVKINPFTGGLEMGSLAKGIALASSANSDMTPSTTAIVAAGLSGYGDDYFNNHFYLQVLVSGHELLTIDGAPTPADFAAGATLEGASSGKTCTVVAKLTSTTYLVKDRSGVFTDGEILSDGTNSVDCGAGYPTIAAGQAPQSEVRKITDYVSASGTFTTDAFSQVVSEDSALLVMHESLIATGRNDADNVFDSSAVTKNRDGSVLERTEFIIDALMGTQFRTEQSHAGPVEENGFEMFNIALFDLDSGAIASADINITAISAVLEKSTGGADFSSAGITQPVFAKGDGRVYCSYQFLAAQWTVGDLYRLTVTGISATVDTETVYCPTMVWSNAVLEAANIDANVETILAELAGDAGVATFPGAANPGNGVSLAEVIRAIVHSLAGGDDYDGYTNINGSANVSLNAIAQKFAALLAADGANVFNPTIQGSARTDLELALNALATYLSASGAAWSVAMNNGAATTDLEATLEAFLSWLKIDGANQLSKLSNATPATLDAALQSFAATLGIDDANTFDPAMFGGSQTTIEAAFAAIGAALGVEFDGTPNLYDLLATGFDSSGISNNFDGSILEVLKSGLEKTTSGAFDADTDSNEALSDKLGAFSGDGGAAQDDSVKASLDLAHTDLGAILADIGDPSARANLKSIEAMLGNPDVAGATLYAAMAGTLDAVNRAAAKDQVKTTTIDLQQAAGNYDLFTGTTQDVLIEKLGFRMPNVNCADDATITAISIQSNDATPQVFITSLLGAKANLTAEAQISWAAAFGGPVILKAGKKIQLTIAGGPSDAATVCDVVVEYKAVTSGGYLT